MQNLIDYGPYLGVVLTILLGLLSIAFPRSLALFLGRATNPPVAPDFVRVQLGGAQLFLGIFCLYSRSPSAFWTAGFFWLGILLMRIVQANLDGEGYAWRPALLEFLMAVSLLASFVLGF